MATKINSVEEFVDNIYFVCALMGTSIFSWRPESTLKFMFDKFLGFLSNLTVYRAADPPTASLNRGDLCTVSAYPSSNICSRLV